MLLDNDKLSMLEESFTAEKEKEMEGLNITQFVKLLMNSIHCRKEEEVDLVFGLVKLFKDIDINGDGTMEWEEFTQYLIETMVGDNGISGASGNYSSGATGHTDRKFWNCLKQLLIFLLDKTGILIKDTENDILNRAYGRKAKNYALCGIVDLTAHQEPIKKIVPIKLGKIMLILEQNSKYLKFYSQNLKCFDQIVTSSILNLKNSSNGYIMQSLYTRQNNSIPKSLSSAPIITDVTYSPPEDLMLLSTSNKLILFYRLNPPIFSSQQKTHLGILPQILHIYEPQYPVSNLFYLKQSQIFVIRTTEHKLFFLKVVQKMDSFKVVILSTFGESEHVLSCLELERTRYLATAGLGGKIKIWNMSKATPKYINCLEDYGPRKARENENSELYVRRKIEKEEKGVVKMIYTRKGPGLLLSLGFENSIVVWSPDTSLSKAYIGRLEGHTAIVKDMVFVLGTFLVISVDEKFCVKIWDVRKLEVIQTIKEDRFSGNFIINCIAYLPRSDKFVLGGRRLQIYDNLQSVKEVRSFNDCIIPIKCAFNTYFQAFIILTKNDLRMVDSHTGKISQVFNHLLSEKNKDLLTSSQDLTDFCFDERERKILISDSSGGLRVFNVANGELIEEISSPDELKTNDDGLTLYQRA